MRDVAAELKSLRLYARGTLLDKRRRLMADWAKHCSTLANVASVTPINSKSAA